MAKSVESHGVDAGIATLFVIMFLEKNGAFQTVRHGIDLYLGLVKDGAANDCTKNSVENLDYWCYMARSGPKKEVEFPLGRPEGLDNIGGLANVFLYVGALKMSEGSSSLRE